MGVVDDLEVTLSAAPARPAASTDHSNRPSSGCRDSDVRIKAKQIMTTSRIAPPLPKSTLATLRWRRRNVRLRAAFVFL